MIFSVFYFKRMQTNKAIKLLFIIVDAIARLKNKLTLILNA